jgi:glycopeptide antibiotics resistance protein
MRTWVILGLWLAGILFPLAWLGRFSPLYRRVFDHLFGAEWAHIVMHAALYVILGVLVIAVAKLPRGLRTVLAVIVSVLAIGVLQEAFQFISQGGGLLRPEILAHSAFDLTVDLVGGLLALLLVYLFKKDKVWHPSPL